MVTRVLGLILLVAVVGSAGAEHHGIKRAVRAPRQGPPARRAGMLAVPKGGLPRRGGAAVATKEKAGVPGGLKLVIGAGGIYAAFMYYGLLMEDVFAYRDSEGVRFEQVWFLQILEACANVLVGGIGLKAMGATPGMSHRLFALTGASQVSAKAFTTLALAKGVSFPVLMLAKSAKMVPVMIGSILLGGASYSLREYLQVAAIIGGTCMVSLSKKKGSGGASSTMGLACIVASLTCDGITGGVQKRLKKNAKDRGLTPKPYDFMFWTNLFMLLSACVVALVNGELFSGAKFCADNPAIFDKILRFAACSAFGQSFIFYTIANFDPLVCTTVTTTRKIFSVLLSIAVKGHALNQQGWAGVAIASGGILGELEHKFTRSTTVKPVPATVDVMQKQKVKSA